MTANLDDPYILITDKKISSSQEIMNILEEVVRVSGKLLIIADEVEGEALNTIVLNKLRGVFTSVAVKTPSFGEKRKAMLEDIAILTGGKVFSNELSTDFKNFVLEDLGRAKTVTIDKDNTIIVEGKGNVENIKARINSIKTQLQNANGEYEKEKLADRLAKLSGGVAVIKVGAMTEVELKEKKLRIEDALSATKSATEEGVVAGGGIALLKCSEIVENFVKKLESDEKIGGEIIKKALFAPIIQICENAGVDSKEILEKILQNKDKDFGFDAYSEEFCNMIEKGIIDPTKVTRSALQNATSVAGTMLTTEVLVAEIEEKENQTSNGEY